MTAAPKVSHITAKQRAADAANLRKARAVARRLPRTARQVAASRRNLAAARSAQRARRSGKGAVTAKKPAAPAPDTWTRYDVRLGEVSLLELPACGPLALAEHLGIMTGALAGVDDILAFWQESSGSATLADLLEQAKAKGLAGNRLRYFERCNPGCDAPGLIYGIQLNRGYHAAVGVPGGMISWCRIVPRDGNPEEAWWLEWEGG